MHLLIHSFLQILSGHVAAGALSLASLEDGGSIATIAGTSLAVATGGAQPIDLTEDGVTVTAPAGGSTVTVLEAVECTDSVLYVVDGVLVPGDVQLPGACGSDGQAPCESGCAEGFREREGACQQSG